MKIIKQSLRSLAILVLTGGFGFIGFGNVSAAEFSYNGDEGPAYWWELDAQWSACAGIADDARQSPIDIDDAKVDSGLKPLALQTYPTTIDIFNNGHTIEQRYEDTGSSVVFDGREYELTQFHFHTFSEHVVNGERSKMEMHAVFTEPVSGDNLVVGELFRIGKKMNPFIQSLIDAGLPKKNGDETQTNDLIDLSDGLDNTHSYYTYGGSLTTPACTENVTWIVLKNQATVTQGQWEEFRSILGNNFRPLQQRNDRTVFATPGRGKSKGR
jgi:carbonic anhydrase